MREKRFSPLALIITAAVTLVLTLAAVALTAWLRLGPGGLAVFKSMDLIRDRFVGEYDEDEVIDAALDAAVDALGDRWSLYLDAEAYDKMLETRRNSYVGVGLTYVPAADRTYMEIIGITSGGPAQQAGLQVGERITAIDGQALAAENFDALVATISAATDRAVTFTVLDGAGKSREVSVTATEVNATSVEYELLDSGIGYVRLYNFYAGSAEEAEDAVDDLAAQGAKALLFDVRSNPGGYVDELTDLLDHLLGEGPIFTEHTKNGPVKTIESDAQCVDLPMAVLINADSYSAAELFAAQLRESVDAPLIGAQTCGKGYYQQSFGLPNGGGLNISTGMYATGAGNSLIGVGLVPDVSETDPERQMEQALACLEERIG